MKACYVWLVAAFILTGCWDHREIEELGIITGVAIDKPEDSDQSNMLTVTNQYVLPQSISSQVKSGTSGNKPYVNETVTAPSVLQTIREQSKFVSRPPYYYHLKTVVISKELAENTDLLKLTYFFYRDHEIRRSVQVFISDEKAKDLFTITPEEDKVPSIYLDKITHNYATKTAEMAPSISLGDMSKYFSHKKSFIIPFASLKENAVYIDGGIIVNANSKKTVGVLTKDETRTFNWINERSQGGVIEVFGLNENQEHPFTFEIKKMNSKVKPFYQNGELTYDIHLSFKGKLGEDWSYESDQFNQEYVEKQQKAVEERIRTMVVNSIEKAQKEHEVDYFELMEPFRIKYTKEWYKVKDEWNQFFTKANFNVDVSVLAEHYQDVGRKLPFTP
ncbi:Ger(x)C family spore germination protein [Pontibacillus sp. ALD_SL1]|uniref:Ger(x)C family spore germination protein n=1 Tax=Pontibacillus sp. ALD_SL1 TaxID=2777185 RepID=UPI001A95C060|nr:Ger(x)C family spore germination protein [Pontibacillus sp. ALD_SL1]QSS98889.1 Ger(x)C family spore germination protein [Pontibacillus sp. ALD_SL1]